MSASATLSGALEHEAMESSMLAWFAPLKNTPAKLREAYGDWLSSEQALIEMATDRIYESRDVSSLDLRFHLGALSSAIAAGQGLVLQALLLRDEGAVSEDFFLAEIALLDEHIAQLVSRLNEWHGTIDSQGDIPAALKQAFQEASVGDVIPFPKD